MKQKIIDLISEWPDDEDEFISGLKLSDEDESEMESWCRAKGFNLNWTGNGYLLVIIHEGDAK